MDVSVAYSTSQYFIVADLVLQIDQQVSVEYSPVLWNNQKKKYDLFLVLFVIMILSLVIVLNLIFFKEITEETLIIRTAAIVAICLLHVILAIGPLSRISPAFLVLLYNRRHLGVTMFFFAAIHGIFGLVQYHGLANVSPLKSLFLSNVHYGSFYFFPFQILGFIALIILTFMAATSHDIWLKNLSPKGWKTLHKFVYLAYVLILFHVLLGTIQNETSLWMPAILASGAMVIVALHISARFKNASVKFDRSDTFVKVGKLNSIPLNRAMTVHINGVGIAIYRSLKGVFAVSSSCRHQGGPIGEGKIIEGCITCPWHGYQYQPEDGKSPPPFEEELDVFQVKIEKEEIWLDATPK